MDPAVEHRILLLSVQPRLTPGQQQQLGVLLGEISSAEALLRLAAAHGVTALVLRQIRPFIPSLAPDLSSRLDVELQSLIGRTEVLAGELGRLLDGFERDQVRVVPLKGPVLAERLYGDTRLRDSADLDLVVPENARSRALALLGQLGYRPTLLDVSPAAAGKFFARRDYYRFLSEEVNLMLPDPALRVELHWRFVPRYMQFDAETAFWEGLNEVDFAGRKVPLLDPENLLVYSCVQGSKQGWEKLIRVVDVAWLLYRCPGIDWKRVRELAERGGGRRMVNLGLELVGKTLVAGDFTSKSPDENPVFEHAVRELGGDPQARRLAEQVWRRFETAPLNTSRSPLEKLRFGIVSRERKRDGLRFAVRYLTCPTAAEAVLLPLPTDSMVLYALVRWVRMLRWALNVAWRAVRGRLQQ